MIFRFSRFTRGFASVEKPRVIKGIVFDMDGTLTEPNNIDFKLMRSQLNISDEVDILGHLETLSRMSHWEVSSHFDVVADDRDVAERLIVKIENDSLRDMRLQPGFNELMQFLDERGIRKAVLTRNHQLPVDHFLKLHDATFDPVVTRNSVKPPKPHPAPLLHIAQQWQLDPSEMLMVGDHADDILCGVKANVGGTVFLGDCVERLKQLGITPDLHVTSLSELQKALQTGIPK